MRNKRSAETIAPPARRTPATRCCPRPRPRTRCSSTCPATGSITVTASPSKGLEATLDLAERLTGHGYGVVPHLAARMISGRSELSEIAERLTGKGISRVFVPGGDAEPAGDYLDALGAARGSGRLGRPFVHVGITGYPESHPTIARRPDRAVDVGQAPPRHPHRQQPDLRPGGGPRLAAPAPGPGGHHAAAAGHPRPGRAHQAARRWRPGSAWGSRPASWPRTRALSPGWPRPAASPGERFLEKCAPALGEPGALVEGLHVFTFNQIAETEAWRTDLARAVDGAVVKSGLVVRRPGGRHVATGLSGRARAPAPGRRSRRR